jgi:c-di-GMP-binding flagellar brake protein YcgR
LREFEDVLNSMPPQAGKALKSASERRQRRFPRFRIEFPVTLKLLSSDGHQSLSGHCKDLSEAGMGILIASELGQGEVVALNFALPTSANEWNVRAVLRHRRGYHYGFEFLSLPEDGLKTLRAYLPTLKRADDDVGTPFPKSEASSAPPRKNT